MKHFFTTLCLAGGSIFSTAFAGGLDTYTLDPANGATVKALEEVTVTFPDLDLSNEDLMFSSYAGKGTITNGTITYSVDPGAAPRGNYKTLIFVNEEGEEVSITEAGEWTLSLEAGFARVWDWDSEDILFESPAITAVYTVEGGEQGGGGSETGDEPWMQLEKWISSPASGATVSQIEKLTLGFPGFEPAEWGRLAIKTGRISLSNGNESYSVSFGLGDTYVAEGFNNYNCRNFYPVDDEGEYITLTTPGTYTWTFGAGAFQSLDEDDEVLAESEAFTVVMTIEGEDPLAYSFSPEKGAEVAIPEENLVVTMTFPNASEVSTEAVAPDSVLEGGAESRGCRVTYGSEMIARVDDASAATGYSVTADGNKLLFTFSKDIFAANNTLSITADEGAFGVDGQSSPAFAYILTVGEAKEYSYTISPASGAESETLETFTISFPTATTAKFVEGSYVVLMGSRMLTQYNCVKVEDAEHPTFELTFDPAPYLAGFYRLTVEEGAFILDGSYSSPEIMAGYTLLRTSEVDTTITPSPNGSKVVAYDYGTYVNFIFADDETVYGSDSNWREKVEVKFDDVVLTAGTDYAISLRSAEGIYYMLMIDIEEGKSSYAGKTGTLSVTAPEGTFTISGQPSPAIDKTWQVIPLRSYDYSFTPAANEATPSLSEITITFHEAEEAEVFRNSFVNLRATDYSSYFNLTDWSTKMSEEGASVVMTFNPGPTEDGSYTLSCDYSAFVIDGGIESPNIDALFILDKNSGASVIKAENGGYTVYSVDGKMVLNKAEGSAINSLEPGLYIINGKKVNLR